MDNLQTFNHVHDWHVDGIRVSKEREGADVEPVSARPTVSLSFVGMNRCAFENPGLQNIVYGLEILELGTPRHEKAQHILATAQRCTDKKPSRIAQTFSTCGAELVAEVESLEIEAPATRVSTRLRWEILVCGASGAWSRQDLSVRMGKTGGGCGIRTHEGRKALPVFKTGAFNRSANPPSPKL